jgi:plasmid stability protein
MAQLQIRDVPADLHRKLRARAANIGQSLSEYVLDELARSVERNEELDRMLESDAVESADEPAETAAPSD